MTPLVPDPDTTDAAQRVAAAASSRAADVIEFWARAVGLLSAVLTFVWAAVHKVWKPYKAWRMKARAEEMRALLKPELQQLTDLLHEEQQCTEQMQAIFTENDEMFSTVRKMHDYIEETHDLLNALGLNANDRRALGERREQITDTLDALGDRRRQRRRRGDRPEKPEKPDRE